MGTMEKSNGKIWGFVGPIGGGKTYQLEAARGRSETESRVFITGDFSDGIRSSVLKIFDADPEAVMCPSSREYLGWKDLWQTIRLPMRFDSGNDSCNEITFRGRDLLRNIGEYIKTLAGEDVWARWTRNDICRKYWDLPEEERDYCDIAFGSVRFGVEAKMVFSVADVIGKEVNLIFCN